MGMLLALVVVFLMPAMVANTAEDFSAGKAVAQEIIPLR